MGLTHVWENAYTMLTNSIYKAEEQGLTSRAFSIGSLQPAHSVPRPAPHPATVKLG